MLKLTRTNIVLMFLVMLLAGVIFALSYYNIGHWAVNILAYTIPILLLILFLGFFLMLITKRLIVALFILFTFCFLGKPLYETISIGYLFKPKEQKDDVTIKAITFNVSTFNKQRVTNFVSEDPILKHELFSFLTNVANKPDILCMQEFHHDDAENQKVIDMIIGLTGAEYYFTVPVFDPNQNGFFGLMTMSKYPIINKGVIFKGEMLTLNMGVYLDVKTPNDTIRVINIHLQSMSIRLNDTSSISLVGKILDVAERLKMGSIRSKEQIQPVLDVIQNSPYPILLCGDFNTFPYGYTYQIIKETLNNSFESAGKGFGYSLNILPYFARIDNQFCSKEFIPIESRVIREIKHSDHFPVFAKYLFKKEK
jgi:endonuclease/exonuclease/phosphatase family metal-dependent hydrolase